MVTLDEGGRGRAALTLVAPAPRLAGLAEHLWVHDVTRHGPGVAGWRVVPDEAPHLIWHVHERDGRERRRLVLVGPRSTFADVDTRGRTSTVGVRLRPGALRALFAIPAAEATDRVVPLDDVLRGAGRDAVRRVLDAPPEDALRHLEELLLARARAGRPVGGRAAALDRLTAGGNTRVGDVARALGLAARTLRDVARAELGLSARSVLRIRRVHTALHLGIARRRDWARAAAMAGYVDQPHLIRECRALLGETPAAFAARARGAAPPEAPPVRTSGAARSG